MNVVAGMNAVVEISHLNKSFSGQRVLRDINMSVYPGEVVGLLGPNGAGKSSLMKILLGIWKADANRKDDGVCMIRRPDRIGYLSEQNPLYDEMYVHEYLLFMAQMTEGVKRKKEEVERLIEQVGLGRESHKLIRYLSKGYRQRVGLACALMGEPQLLILDEPTTGLDPNQLDDIRRVIRLTGERCPVILSTHILQEVREMCSRVVVLDHGQIRANSLIADIQDLEQFFHQATQQPLNNC